MGKIMGKEVSLGKCTSMKMEVFFTRTGFGCILEQGDDSLHLTNSEMSKLRRLL